MSNFVERLKEFIEDSNLTQRELESKVGVSKSTLSEYINDKSTPLYNTLIKLLCYFDCSADYLLGLDEFPTEEKLYPPLPFKDQFKKILKEKHISQSKLQNDLKVSRSVPYKWISGKAEPTAPTLITLAKYFDCSVDYLIGRRR